MQQNQPKQPNFRQLQEISLIGNWEYYFKNDLMLCSDSIQKILGGQSPDHQKEALALIHPEDQGLFLRKYDFSSAESVEFAFRMNPKTFPSRNLLLNRMEPVYDTNGKLLGLKGHVVDLKEADWKTRIYDQLFHLSGIGNILIKNGKFLNCNQRFEEITGYHKAELAAMNLLDLVVPAQRNHFQTNHLQADRKEVQPAMPYKTQLIRKNGTKVKVLVSSSFVPGTNILTGSITDISELEESKSIFRQSFNLSDAGKAIIAKGFHLISCNKKFEEITGYTSEELKTLSLERFIHPSFIEEVRKRHFLRFDTNNLSDDQYDFLITHQKGYPIWIRLYVVPIPDTEKLYVTIEDISAKKAMELKLSDTIDERNSFRESLNKIALVSITDIKGQIIYANETFVEISKYSRDELLGQDHKLLNSGHHPKSFWIQMWKQIAKGNSWRAEVKNQDKGGGYYWVDTTVNPVRNKEGKIVQYMSVRYPITERKELEEHREKILEDFQEYAFLTSHKLRGPLARMQGLISLFKAGVVEASELVRVLSMLEETSTEMDEIIGMMNEALNRNSLSELVREKIQYNLKNNS